MDWLRRLTSAAGPGRELGAASGGEHQEGLIHTRPDRALCLWQEPDAACRRPPRRPADLRYHRD